MSHEQDQRDRELQAAVRAALASEAQRLEDLRSAAATLQSIAGTYGNLGTRASNTIATRARKAADLTRELLELMHSNATDEGSR